MSLVTPDHPLDASLDALGPLVARTTVAAAGVAPRGRDGGSAQLCRLALALGEHGS
jgi:hypothetical protein